jgi:hypothetical protein
MALARTWRWREEKGERNNGVDCLRRRVLQVLVGLEWGRRSPQEAAAGRKGAGEELVLGGGVGKGRVWEEETRPDFHSTWASPNNSNETADKNCFFSSKESFFCVWVAWAGEEKLYKEPRPRPRTRRHAADECTQPLKFIFSSYAIKSSEILIGLSGATCFLY